jgi:predicted nucleic-acid-binding protein
MQIKEFIETKIKSDKPNKVIVFNPLESDLRKELIYVRKDKKIILAKEIYSDSKCPFSEHQVIAELKKSFGSNVVTINGELVETWEAKA